MLWCITSRNLYQHYLEASEAAVLVPKLPMQDLQHLPLGGKRVPGKLQGCAAQILETLGLFWYQGF